MFYGSQVLSKYTRKIGKFGLSLSLYCMQVESKDTCCHELLHAAPREGGVLRPNKIEVEPVGQLYVRAQLHRVILVLPRDVQEEPAVVQIMVETCI